MRIEGMAAVVTGGASGLGAATARRLAGRGARVAVLDLNEAGARAVAGEIGGLGLACDVSDEDSAQAALARAAEAHGPARLLVNCAGIVETALVVGRDGPMPLAEHRRVVEVHLFGTFNMTRLAAAAMRELEPEGGDGERGVIVNTSSIAAFDGPVGAASYVAAKAGIAAMTLPLARELGRYGIRVMAIAPGLFETPMSDALPDRQLDSMLAAAAFPRRKAQPAEYASLVESIVETPMLNGTTIRLDGGLHMG